MFTFFCRITAKKFYAASNFLEILKTFPKTDTSESVSWYRLPFSSSPMFLHRMKTRFVTLNGKPQIFLKRCAKDADLHQVLLVK